jgi:hypothetical protein
MSGETDPRKTFIDLTVKQMLEAVKELIELIQLDGDEESKAKVDYLAQANELIKKFLEE